MWLLNLLTWLETTLEKYGMIDSGCAATVAKPKLIVDSANVQPIERPPVSYQFPLIRTDAPNLANRWT